MNCLFDTMYYFFNYWQQTAGLTVTLTKSFLTYGYVTSKQYVLDSMQIGIIENNKKSMTIGYIHGPQYYKIKFPKRRVLSVIQMVINEGCSGTADITQEFLEYLGPSKNFHGIIATPNFYGWNKVKICFVDGSEIIYNRDDLLVM